MAACLILMIGKSVPPTAPRGLPGGRVSDEKPDTQGDDSRRMGVLFHEPLEEVMAGDGGALDRLSAFHRRIHGLALGLLHRTTRLACQPLGLGFGVAGNSASAILHLSCERANRAREFVGHQQPPHTECLSTSGTVQGSIAITSVLSTVPGLAIAAFA
jgi:hypothetical protein